MNHNISTQSEGTLTLLNLTMYEGFLLIIGGLRFIQEPLGPIIIALGGILTLFERPGAAENSSIQKTFLQIRTAVGVIAIAVSSIILAYWALSDIAQNQSIVSDTTLNLLTVPH